MTIDDIRAAAERARVRRLTKYRDRGIDIQVRPGSEAPNALLTDAAVRELRAAYDRGDPISPIARRLGVSTTVASKAARRERWRSVPD